jgi:hypothetical protein
MASLSEGLTSQAILEAQGATLTALNTSENGSIANLFRATPYAEKPYIESFLNERDPERRQEILNSIPDDLGQALQRQWQKHDSSGMTKAFVDNTSRDIASGRKQFAFNEQIMDPRMQLDDIKLKVVESRGYDAHEFGLGWNDQMIRVQNTFNNIQDINKAEYERLPTSDPSINPAQVRSAISNLINSNGLKANVNVYINNGRSNGNAVTINIKRDRAQTIVNALSNRKKYYNGN